MTASLPRKSPCASCPYRQNVPSGVWDAEEYAKLPAYDRDTGEQPTQAFGCHQGDGKVCAGWLAFGEPYDLLAVRIGIAFGTMDPSCGEYTTDVPLFSSGAEAAAHGMRDIEHPSAEAVKVGEKIIRKREL